MKAISIADIPQLDVDIVAGDGKICETGVIHPAFYVAALIALAIIG